MFNFKRCAYFDGYNDIVKKDIVRVTAGPVISSAEFREQIKAEITEDEKNEQKQTIADIIMAVLEEMHITAEEKRQKLFVT